MPCPYELIVNGCVSVVNLEVMLTDSAYP